MLRKLLKYELLSTSRVFGLSYVVLLASAALVRLLTEIAYRQSEIMEQMDLLPIPLADIFAGLSAFLYFGVIVAVCVVTLIFILQRFYKNLLTGEGYLMHTLPVTTHQLLMSKLIAAVVWTMASSVAVLLSLYLLVATPQLTMGLLAEFTLACQAFQQEIHFPFLLLCLEFAVVLLVAAAGSILEIYASIMLGHQAPKYRIALAVVAYFAIQMILSTATVFVMVGVVMVPTGVWNSLGAWLAGLGPVALIQLFMAFLLVSNLVLAAVFYCITAYLMHRRLNLE